GPGFGFQHFKQYDFLRTGEVVLTFDDGPWPENTPAVLKALSDNCLKATFFEIGQHAMWHPEIAKQVAAGGNTVGTHTWSHKDLAKNPYASDTEQAKQEIEMGISAVHMAGAAPISPFFRFPALQHPPELLSYLAERNTERARARARDLVACPPRGTRSEFLARHRPLRLQEPQAAAGDRFGDAQAA